MMDTMATAQNVNRNKYDFDESFLRDLAMLHDAVSRQNEGVEFQEKIWNSWRQTCEQSLQIVLP